MIRRTAAIALLITTGALFSQSKTSHVRFQEGCTSVSVDVSIFDNVVYIPISINDTSPVDFVLDTGAPELSVIASEIAAELALERKSGGDLQGAGKNSVAFKLIEEVTLSVDSLNIINPRTAAFSLVHMEPYWGRPKYGLVGGNILKELVTEIDYVHECITFHKPANYEYRGPGKRIPVQIIANAIHITAQVQQQGENDIIKGTFIVDTAVRNTFFNSPFTREHRLIEKSEEIVENITGFGLGGVSFGRLNRLKSIELGGFLLDGPIVELTTDTKGVAAGKRFDGIIGADLLSRFTVILDYPNQEMILHPNNNFSDPFEYDKSGMYLIMDSNDTFAYSVAHVIPGSPASNAGIEKGDIVLQVDDIPARNFTYEEIKNYFKRDVKTIKVTTRRVERITDLEIKPARLL